MVPSGSHAPSVNTRTGFVSRLGPMTLGPAESSWRMPWAKANLSSSVGGLGRCSDAHCERTLKTGASTLPKVCPSAKANRPRKDKAYLKPKSFDVVRITSVAALKLLPVLFLRVISLRLLLGKPTLTPRKKTASRKEVFCLHKKVASQVV